MKNIFTRRDFLLAASAAAVAANVRGQSPTAKASFPYVDGLCLDLPEDAVIRASGLSAYLLDASATDEIKAPDGTSTWRRNYSETLKSIAAVRQRLRTSSTAFLATNGKDVSRAHKEGKTAVFLQVQGGGEIVDTDLDRINVLGELGLRVLQMTHHHNNALAGGGIEKNPSGLTKLGYEAVERLNVLGIIPDLSHASDQTALDTAKASKKPVILSHGAARAFVNNARCAPDNVIKAIADTGGVMGVFMMSFWLTTDAVPTVEHYVKQIRHVANVGGIDAVGIANDFPLAGEENVIAAKGDNSVAVKNYLGWWQSIARMGILGFDRTPEHVAIPELNNINRISLNHQALEKAGFKPAEQEKIMGANWIRILTST
ncbi:MAG: membrane dipeptidase [Pyrinomonadaceae bacterium]|nr:membrane dipeptidase [Pyrinomonadaceae bacterium]